MSSEDGLDELSTSAPTTVVEVNGERIERYTVSPADCGLPEAPPDAVGGGRPEENAATTRAILAGEAGPRARPRRPQRRRRDLRGRARGLDRRRACGSPQEAVDSGAAARTLDAYVELSQAA